MSNSNVYHNFCKGRGIEIGPGENPILDLDTLKIDIVRKFRGRKHIVDLVWPCDNTPFFYDNQFDFVISNNCFEHFRNPIKAVMEWHRITRVGGIIFLIIPDCRLYILDRKKTRTNLKYLIDDFEKNVGNYPEEITEENLAPYVDHQHFWILEDIVELFEYLDGFEIKHALENPPQLFERFYSDFSKIDIKPEILDQKQIESMLEKEFLLLKSLQRKIGLPELAWNFEIAVEVKK